MEALYFRAFGTKPPYKTLAETVFSVHLLWTILSPLQMVFLYFFGLAYVPYFIIYIALNILGPMPWRACPLTKLEKYYREKVNDTLDAHLTFVQRLCKRWFGFIPARWKVHLMHGTFYTVSGIIILFKLYEH